MPTPNTCSRDDCAEPIKCLIWDLDDTLWHGRILEGEFPRLRESIHDVLEILDRRGILLSVASNNDHALALRYLKHFDLDQYFIAPEINFGSKYDSVSRISTKLDIDLRHIGFVDDDPFERQLISETLPEVRVFDACDHFTLPSLSCLNPDVLTEDSARRRMFVLNEIERQNAEVEATDLGSFLENCNIKFHFRSAKRGDLNRILELTLRTNRMNASAELFTANDLIEMLEGERYKLFIATMTDRFGDYGAVATALVSNAGESLYVRGLWMSCRVTKRGLPHCVFTSLADVTSDLGLRSLQVAYRSTSYNRLALFHLTRYGFRFRQQQNASDLSLLEINIPDQRRPYPTWIEVTT